MTVPVVVFVYNRLELLKRVLKPVLAWSPSKLLLVADGPKRGQQADEDKCRDVRTYLDGLVTSGDVERLYSDVNLGAGRRIASGLDWVFTNFEEAIILEDDLLADPT